MSNDRRSSTRVTADFNAILQKNSPGESTPSQLTSKVRNVSRGGIFVKTEYSLSAGERVELEFELPGIEDSVKAEGVVRWTRRSGKEKGLGIEFTDVDSSDHEKIKKYAIEKLQREGVEHLTATEIHRKLLMLHEHHVAEQMTEQEIAEALQTEDDDGLQKALNDFLDAGLLVISGESFVFRSLADMEIGPAVKEWRELQEERN